MFDASSIKRTIFSLKLKITIKIVSNFSSLLEAQEASIRPSTYQLRRAQKLFHRSCHQGVDQPPETVISVSSVNQFKNSLDEWKYSSGPGGPGVTWPFFRNDQRYSSAVSTPSVQDSHSPTTVKQLPYT
ncbi:hypothetical protein BpHYR1_051704 [Brachionus plicatilis]|uniref:Uncharacterized protein n=1 Tax=Brachionus plicatilis TaxID=10195 RepID=A0A3M7SHK5_BRAPC|nr:hypothetical protein BpHYR1_051704 [Brachionus plicatilis]